ncbi:uncharacterized protein AMSG_03243 [Thecamonas trahens ATCC 50062]|uniref:Uncharacterized protein n=1 Tax=Thecamonas trahens ATCC 50062 TaxID=461836 RepID=A0A0L0D396_THETB|nr:hypothetical protein AMSG_03243 [Thecamonas trahens ATCC 50062]KNC46812.1 hypothetical protein AMSG_03243 [Thecamonas trahens ATCC 50062]|eukprot:XP_013760087.1 hypothetical protein AMSG_03243 [Thecamonas trahens ATCC 50062]
MAEYSDSHFALGAHGGAELDPRIHAAAPHQAYSSGAPPPAASPSQASHSYYAPGADEPYAAYRPRPSRGPAHVPDANQDPYANGHSRGLRMPYGRGVDSSSASAQLASGTDPQHEYEHYAKTSGAATRRIFDPRSDRDRMREMQRFQAATSVNNKRYNPVLQRYADDSEERAARDAESRRRSAQLQRHARAPQAELGSVRDLHVGKLKNPPRRRGAGAVGPPPDSDIFNPNPLPYRPGKRHSEIDYTRETEEWWNLKRDPPPPPPRRPPNPYSREAKELLEKNQGTNMTDILQPDRHKTKANMLRSPSPTHHRAPRRSRSPGYSLEGVHPDPASSYTSDLLRHEAHIPSAPEAAPSVSNLSNIGLDHTSERRQPSKRVFADNVHHRTSYNIVSGHSYDGSDGRPRLSRRPLKPEMQAGKGVAKTLVYRGPGDPGSDPATNNGAGYSLTGSKRRGFAPHIYGETGADNWKETNPKFTFKRY